jgi:hypothetical protein
MSIRLPLGLYDGASGAEGIAPYAGSAIPGPLGTGPDDGGSRLGTAEASRPAEVAPAANVGITFALGPDRYRLLRLDAEWRPRVDEVRVPPEHAVEIIKQAAEYERNPEVVHLFETAASRLAGLHEEGVFVLLQRRLFDGGVRSGAPTAPSSTPSAFRPSESPELPSSIDEPTMGAEQAKVLRDAAAVGVPFCEECARAAAQQGGATAA